MRRGVSTMGRGENSAQRVYQPWEREENSAQSGPSPQRMEASLRRGSLNSTHLGYTQGGIQRVHTGYTHREAYQGGIPLHTHPGRHIGRYTPLYIHPERYIGKYTTVIYTQGAIYPGYTHRYTPREAIYPVIPTVIHPWEAIYPGYTTCYTPGRLYTRVIPPVILSRFTVGQISRLPKKQA